MRLPLLLALASGLAVGWAGYADAYFPQNDVFSYYQIFHYVYSSIVTGGEIPLWQPYASYGLPNAFEMAFTFGSTKAAAALLGALFRIADIKLLYFGAVGADFALIGVAAALLARELSGKPGPHVALAAVAMPLSHYMETQPNFSYGFALTFLFVMLFIVRFLRTRQAIYLLASALVLVANVYGNPQYLVIPEVYLGALFALMAGLRYRTALAAEWRRVLSSAFTPPALALALLTAALAAGLIAIDREAWETIRFSARLRDPHTLLPSLRVFLYYLYQMPGLRLLDVFDGRPVTTYDVWLYFGAGNLAVLLYGLAFGWRTRFVPELLILLLLLTAFSLPNQFPVAEWVYDWLPWMKLYRPVSYASVFAKPFAILAVTTVLADARTLEGRNRAALLYAAATVVLIACMFQAHRYALLFYWDSFVYGWIAIAGGLALAAALLLLLSSGNRLKPWGPAILALVLGGEVAAHRIAFEATFYAALAEIRPTPAEAAGQVLVEPWYKWPRALVYQPVRVDLPTLAAPYEPIGDRYHGMWSFLGIDPCIPGARSDTYARWVGEALKRRGATDEEMTNGDLENLGSDFAAAFGCGPPKLTISDPAGDARVVRFSADDVAIAVTTPAGGELVYRDAWLPAWQATLDGKRVPLARNADGFKMLEVPPGEHRVELAFRPLVGEGAVVALACLLGLSLVAQLWLALRACYDRPERSS
ncbi:MAG: hypothetical protein ACLQME_08290 [Alphaproteobacteria bacterium]